MRNPNIDLLAGLAMLGEAADVKEVARVFDGYGIISGSVRDKRICCIACFVVFVAYLYHIVEFFVVPENYKKKKHVAKC